MLPVATGSDIFESVSLPVLLLNHLPQILGTVMNFTSIVYGSVVSDTAPASDAAQGTADRPRLPVPA